MELKNKVGNQENQVVGPVMLYIVIVNYLQIGDGRNLKKKVINMLEEKKQKDEMARKNKLKNKKLAQQKQKKEKVVEKKQEKDKII